MRKRNIVLPILDCMNTPEIVGNRLYKIRCIANHGSRKQKLFAETLGFEPDSYNQWENGKILCPVYAAITICEWTEYAVTLDYIYQGRDVGPAWLLPLKAAPDRPTFERRPASPSRTPLGRRTSSTPRRRG